MRVDNPLIFTGTVTADGSKVSVEHLLYATIVATGVATLAGTAKVYASVDPDGADASFYDTTKVATLTGTPGLFPVDLGPMGYKWIKIMFAKTGGTGSISVRMHAKGA